MSRRSRASKAIATGVSMSATLTGVGLIAHADNTPSNDEVSAPGPAAVPVAAMTGATGATSRGPAADSATSTVVTATTVLEQPGQAQLPTKSTEPALAVPVPSYDTTTTAGVGTALTQPAGTPATAAPRAGSSNANTGNTNTGNTEPDSTEPSSTETSPVDTAAPTATPTATTTAPPPPPPDTTAAPPPPPTLPPLTAPPDDTSRGTT